MKLNYLGEKLFYGALWLFAGALSASSHLSHLNVSSVFNLNDKVVYGEDDREMVEDHLNEMLVEKAQSVAAHIAKSKLDLDEGGLFYTLNSDRTLGTSLGLCEEERFVEELNPARCSGFLIGEDILATAGHCLNEASCDAHYWVFGFHDLKTTFFIEDVYSCQDIIETTNTYSREDPDYAVIRLDRVVNGRDPLEFRVEGVVADDATLAVIGHPSGISMKIDDGGHVRGEEGNAPEEYFVADLDTFGGNSGSPVFDLETGLIEGILVRGEKDYNYDYENSCRLVNTLEDGEGRGEDVQRITSIPLEWDPVEPIEPVDPEEEEPVDPNHGL